MLFFTKKLRLQTEFEALFLVFLNALLKSALLLKGASLRENSENYD